MSNVMDDIPPQLDRRENGRCRAYWTAYECCPGNKHPFDYATENFTKFLDNAAKLDEKEGLLPCCNRGYHKPKLKPIRTRKRGKR